MCTAPHFCGHFLGFQFVELYATFFPFYRNFLPDYTESLTSTNCLHPLSKGFSIAHEHLLQGQLLQLGLAFLIITFPHDLNR